MLGLSSDAEKDRAVVSDYLGDESVVHLSLVQQSTGIQVIILNVVNDWILNEIFDTLLTTQSSAYFS